ncbi:MAG TPA: YdiU family protein [Polyangiaceae bacterium]
MEFDNSYARLPERFYARVAATKAASPRLVKVNRALAELLGADVEFLQSPAGAEVLAGNVVPDGAEPISQAYAGHQFGGFVPQLGDGRAILLGEVVGTDGQRRDIQLKGAGRTPFSRRGDGRAALGPVLREYIVSEAMAALGIPTTRALAAVTTGEPVIREEVLPGAILTRVAASHIRIGTFQFFANRGDREALGILATHALARHYPDAAGTDNEALALLERVIEAQAKLVARWLGVGFVHGVMNTDNTAISGETIDYGPCAFLDEYDPEKKFSSIDHGGRYAFSNQPRIALWNLARLAEALLPLIAGDPDDAVRLASEHLDRFSSHFERAHLGVMRAKLGLVEHEEHEEHDASLIEGLLALLAAQRVDYTLFFRRLSLAADPSSDSGLTVLFEGNERAIRGWLEAWRRRLALESQTPAARISAMRSTNPAFIPRNHRVEEAIGAAVSRGDFQPFETLVHVLATPHDDHPDHGHLADPPTPEERVQETFCGT